jgi:hypothetical protein
MYTQLTDADTYDAVANGTAGERIGGSRGAGNQAGRVLNGGA